MLTADYTDYNKPVQIKAPPAAEVADMDKALTDFEGSVGATGGRN